MKILITGHQGFIGSCLTLHLEKLGHTILGIDLKSDLDILTCNLPACDLVIHLAAATGVRESISNPKLYWQTNVDGTRRILTHYTNIRVLVASSSSQYEPYLNPYAASKFIAEQIAHNNVCFMRFHTVYSATPRENMFFDKLIKNTLEYVTDHERDFIHVDDLCDAIVLLMETNITGPIDIGTGTSIKISDMSPELPLKDCSQYERSKTLANIDVLKWLGFSPKYTVAEFLKSLK